MFRSFTFRPHAYRALWTSVRLAVVLHAVPVLVESAGAEVRLVTLRDGSRFQATIAPATLELAESGPGGSEIVRTPLPFAEIALAEFSLTPGQEKFAAILRAMAELDAEPFEERERATLWLLRNTSGFRPLLARRANTAGLSPESRWRLTSMLGLIAEEPLSANQRPFDRVYPNEGGTRDGDLGNWEISATFRGADLPLTRSRVASISRHGTANEPSAPETVRRLASPDDPTLGKETRTLDFDADSEGRPLKVGNDISTRFVGDGVTFSTSVAESFVSVNLYEVSGPSRGLSAATHDPLYEGMVTIRFCMPGNPGVPAGVQGVGLWLAVVKERGTKLQALDASGEILTEIETTGPPSEFLGLRSERPIHALRLVPNPDIDPNYTIDDLVFTAQRPVDGLGVENYPSLSFRNADRVVCRDFVIEGGEIVCRPASYPAVTVRSSLTEVQTLYAPLAGNPDPPAPSEFWIELTDGTRLLADADNHQAFSRLPGMTAASLPIAALWGAARVASLPPANMDWTPEEGPLLVDEKGGRTLPPARLGLHWIEPLDGHFPDGTASTYAESPTVWFHRPGRPGPGSGQLRFPNGERIVLGGSGRFRLKGFTDTVVMIEREGNAWKFPFAATSALHLPAP